MKLVTAAEMRAIEDAYLAVTGSAIDDLMARAGRAVANIAGSLVEESASISVFCGKGNNGGDGFVAAQHLSEDGFRVKVFKLAADEDYSGPAAQALAALRLLPVSVVDFTGKKLPPADLVIDALLGFGLRGDITGLAAQAVQAINEYNCPVLSVDVPTGVDSDDGTIHGVAVTAEHTLTFTAPKLGLYLRPGAEYAGETIVADIGVDQKLVRDLAVVDLIDESFAAALVPIIPKSAHKKSAGRVLLVAGSAGMTGAAALAAQAVMRSGAGLCVLVTPASLNDIFEVKLTEVMTVGAPETEARSLDRSALAMILKMESQFDCVAVGPGLSRDPGTVELVQGLIEKLEKPLVLDADGLYAAAMAPGLLKNRSADTIITPHSGELSRLTGTAVVDIEADRLAVARRVTRDMGVTVIHKGFHPIVAAGKRFGVCETGNPGMATAGTGDVLTGIVAGLASKGLGMYEAACLGTYLHGLAGDLAADDFGPIATIASDLLDYIPSAYAMLTDDW